MKRILAVLLFMNPMCVIAPLFSQSSNHQKVQARITTIPRVYMESAVVDTRRKAMVESRIPGVIQSISVQAGERVKKDQVLATIEARELEIRLEQARQNLSRTKNAVLQARQQLATQTANLEKHRKQFERIRSYLEKEAATEQQFEEAKAAFEQAKAQVEFARQGLVIADLEVTIAEKKQEEAKVALSHASIRAPFQGLVTARLQDPGDMALPGKPILQINDTTAYHLKTHLRESAAGILKTGDSLIIEISGEQLNGKVEEIIPHVDAETRTFPVKISFQPSKPVYVGMFARVSIPTGQRSAIIIPRQAIHKKGQLDLVRVQQDGIIHKRYIKTGSTGPGDSIEVRSGLRDGETLLLRNREK